MFINPLPFSLPHYPPKKRNSLAPEQTKKNGQGNYPHTSVSKQTQAGTGSFNQRLFSSTHTRHGSFRRPLHCPCTQTCIHSIGPRPCIHSIRPRLCTYTVRPHSRAHPIRPSLHTYSVRSCLCAYRIRPHSRAHTVRPRLCVHSIHPSLHTYSVRPCLCACPAYSCPVGPCHVHHGVGPLDRSQCLSNNNAPS